MKEEELFKALNDIDDKALKAVEKQLKGSGSVIKYRAPWKRWAAIAACIILLFGAIKLIPSHTPKSDGTGQGSMGYPSDVVALAAEYPEPVAEGADPQEFIANDGHQKWWTEYADKINLSRKLRSGMLPYYSSIMAELLVPDEGSDKNTVCSPLNIYLALSMLAEASEGNTRQQILDMLGASDIESLRSGVKSLWDSNYVDTPMLKSHLANSVWLNTANGHEYNESTLEHLARDYFASSFRGDMSSGDMNQALAQWIDSNTESLLNDYSSDLKLSPDTVMALVSTIYYKAIWGIEFSPENTEKQTFHGTKGDTTVDMMYRADALGFYSTDKFSAVGLTLNDSGAMYFYLPNEGVDVNDLASNIDILNATAIDDDENWSFPMVNLHLPKFKVSNNTDLLGSLRNLGITDAFDPATADFTPITADSNDIRLSKAEHAAMVEIDENGVTGAAYTVLATGKGDPLPGDEIDFVIDRPFLFIVTGSDGSILFSGIVRNIE